MVFQPRISILGDRQFEPPRLATLHKANYFRISQLAKPKASTSPKKRVVTRRQRKTQVNHDLKYNFRKKLFWPWFHFNRQLRFSLFPYGKSQGATIYLLENSRNENSENRNLRFLNRLFYAIGALCIGKTGKQYHPANRNTRLCNLFTYSIYTFSNLFCVIERRKLQRLRERDGAEQREFRDRQRWYARVRRGLRLWRLIILILFFIFLLGEFVLII